MPTLLCLEGWGTIENRADLAPRLVDVALRHCPSLKSARIAGAGKSKELSRPTSEIKATVAGLDASWAVTIFDPARRVRAAPFLISERYFALTMYRDLRGLYFFGDYLDPLRDTKNDLDAIADIVKITGTGLGYCERFAGTMEAKTYSQELRIASSRSDLSRFLQMRSGSSWQDYLPGSLLCVARNLFPVNIWPRPLFERIRSDAAVFESLVSQEAQIVELNGEIVAVRIPSENIAALKPCMRPYLFEQERDVSRA